MNTPAHRGDDDFANRVSNYAELHKRPKESPFSRSRPITLRYLKQSQHLLAAEIPTNRQASCREIIFFFIARICTGVPSAVAAEIARMGAGPAAAWKEPEPKPSNCVKGQRYVSRKRVLLSVRSADARVTSPIGPRPKWTKPQSWATLWYPEHGVPT